LRGQLGAATLGQASDSPWSSSLANTGDGSRTGIAGDAVTVTAMTNKLGGRKLTPVVFHLV